MDNSSSKVWFITGSSRGLGRALAEQALAQGQRVVATARDQNALAPLLARYPDRVLTLDLDVLQPSAAEKAAHAAVERFGRIDVVVNNAGYANRSSIEDFSIEDFREQLDTNFYGVVHVTRALLPILRRQRAGTFLQISSIGGRRGGTPGLSAYQSAKFAVEGFSEVLAAEVAPLGIRVIIVEPGGFRTDWAGASMKVHGVQADYAATVGQLSALARNSNHVMRGDPDKAAKALLAVVDAPQPPRRLLLGTDALFLATLSAQERKQDDETWHALSASTDSEGLSDFADTEIAKMLSKRA